MARAIHQLQPAAASAAGEAELRGHPRRPCWRASCSATSGARSPAPRASAWAASSRPAGGTLFLDEVGELPLDVQAKLLRVLQEREFERLGGTRTIAQRGPGPRRDEPGPGGAGRRRAASGADLYYRLNVFPLHLPPLRERRGDVPLLARHFLSKLARRLGRPLAGFTAESERRLWRSPLAGQRPRAGERGRAGGHPERRPAAGRGVHGGRASRGDGAAAATARHPRARQHRRRPGARGLEGDRPPGAAAALAMHPNTLRYRMGRLGIRRRPGA